MMNYDKDVIITEILTLLKDAPIFRTIDEGIMQADTGKIKVRYLIEAMKLQQVLPVNFESNNFGNYNDSHFRTLAKLSLNNGKKCIIESVSGLELYSVMIELKEYFIKKHCEI